MRDNHYGYHTNPIPKGVLGQFSKIKEEFNELEDAATQDIKLLILNELADLYGAMESYLERLTRYSINMDDIKEMSNLTKKAFQDGYR
jgi:hypothetical protein